jgi:arylsulfatase A-like enzyme
MGGRCLAASLESVVATPTRDSRAKSVSQGAGILQPFAASRSQVAPAWCFYREPPGLSTLMKHLLLTRWFAVVAFTSVLSFATAVAAERAPNVILVLADDQGYPDLGVIGAKPVLTPTLDRLAKEGVRATSFYVTWPACTPSRASLLTGRYPQRNGLYDMVRNDMVNYKHQYSEEEYAVSPEMTLGLDPREITLGNLLQGAGYRTGVFGKWDMGQARRYLPLQRGFHDFYGHGNNGIDYYTHERYGIHSMFRGNQRTKEDQGKYATDLFKREAIRFIRESRGQPFFVYLPFNAPHGASNFDKGGVQAPEEFIRKYPDMDHKGRLTAYYAAVTAMDAAIGEVMAVVKELGQEKNTLFVFLSDNGGSGNGGNAPLRGQKSTMWEGGLRVPFVAWWPGRLPAGVVTDEFLTSLEIFPTLAAISGAKLPSGLELDGFDLLPVLRGEKKSPRTEMFWERRSDRAARVGNWKWVSAGKGGGLFDLSRDLGEKEDVSAKYPEITAKMKAAFAAWKARMDAAEPRGPFRDY